MTHHDELVFIILEGSLVRVGSMVLAGSGAQLIYSPHGVCGARGTTGLKGAKDAPKLTVKKKMMRMESVERRVGNQWCARNLWPTRCFWCVECF